MPSMPFSVCSVTRMPVGDVVRHQRRDADAEIDVEAVAQLLGGARGHLVAGPGHQLPLLRRHGASARLRIGALLDALLVFGTWTMRCTKMPGVWMLVRVDLAGRHQLLDLGDGHLAGRRHHRVEVARGLPVDEVALGVALPGLDDRRCRR